MKGQDYIDEVKLRLLRYDVAYNLNDQKVLTYVNKARRDVQKSTMGLMQERYGKIWREQLTENFDANIDVMASYAGGRRCRVQTVDLPVDFIDVVVTILEWRRETVTYRSEARRMVKKEMYNIQMNAWNMPSMWRPVYILERLKKYERDSTNIGNHINILGLDIDNGRSLFDVADSGTIYLESWYIAALDDLENYILPSTLAANYHGDTEYTVPPDVEELVIYHTMMSCLKDIKEYAAAQILAGEIRTLEGMVAEHYAVTKEKEGTLLPSKEGVE